jgi:Urocanase Rossmann-like domain
MSAEFFHNSQPLDSAGDQSKVAEVFRLYSILASAFPMDAQSGVGGKLFYTGTIGNLSRGSDWVYAANIAGAASLGASADPAALRQAMRDGVIDFLVNSLDEALRILKNEIRKRQAISVGVAAEPYRLVEQMLERGVLPDLLAHSSSVDDAGLDRRQAEKFMAQGSREIAIFERETSAASGKFISWSITPSAQAPHKAASWLPRLDACAQAILPPEDGIRRRWLRLAPRYLGRRMQRQHGVFLTAEESLRLEAEVRQLIGRHTNEGEEAVGLVISG